MMRIAGLAGMIYVRTEGTPEIEMPSDRTTVDVWVEDENGNELFRTNKGADVAIQWAIDYQSSVKVKGGLKMGFKNRSSR